MLTTLQRIALLATAFTIPFPTRVNSIVAVIAGILCIVPNISKQPVKGLLTSYLWIIVAVHTAILLLGLTHSPDTHQGLSDIERFSFVLLVTFITFYMRDSGIKIADLVAALALGCAAIIIYGFILLGFTVDGNTRSEALAMGHTYFTDLIGTHPTYITLYLTFIFFFAIEYWKRHRATLSQRSLALMIASLVVIVAAIFFLRSQMGLIVFVLIAGMYLLTSLKRRAALVVFFLAATALLVYLVDDQRVHTIFDTYGKNVSTALDHRKQIWEGAVLAIGDKPFFGEGTGGEQAALNRAYEQKGYREGVELSYNAHNQYLSFMLRNGIIELLCFLALLVYCFATGIRSGNYSFLIFVMTFALTSVTESCLNVQKGTVFFYLFVAAWLYLPDELAAASSLNKSGTNR